MKKSIIPSPSIIVITTVLYAMIIIFEMNNALEEGENFIVDVDDRSNDIKTVNK